MDDMHIHTTTTEPAPPDRSPEPRLPQELERVIFEIVARSDRDGMIPVLFWSLVVLKPIIYDTLVSPCTRLYNNSLPRVSILRSKPPYLQASFSRPHLLYVKNFLILSNATDRRGLEPSWEDVLPQCHNLQDLALWTKVKPNTLSILSANELVPPDSGSEGISPPEDLTRLELLQGDWDELENLWVEGLKAGCVPNLRYLWIWVGNLRSTEGLRSLLEERGSLEVLILSGNGRVATSEQVHEMSQARRRIVRRDGTVEEVPEDRVVVYDAPFNSFAEWMRAWYESAIQGASRSVVGYDMWHRSERIVQRRRWRRELEGGMWHSMVDSGADVHLGEWMIVMDMY
ncbi:hypothetical protein AX16_006663 [Volvariella volvacea WC 439]|nr:hypothetical protein AX16_006663 [Volvariella volvacea WC 439]